MAFKRLQGEAATDSRGSVFENGLNSSAIGALDQGATGPQGPQGEQGTQGFSIGTVSESIVDEIVTLNFLLNDTAQTNVGSVSFEQGDAIDNITQVPANPAAGEAVTITVEFDNRPNHSFIIPGGIQGLQGQFVEQLFTRSAVDPTDPTFPAVPTAAMFDLSTGTISGTTTSWTDVVPPGTDQLYEIRANIDPVNAVNNIVSIPAASWGTAFQAGSEGPPGDTGPTGDHGTDVSNFQFVFDREDAVSGDRIYNVTYDQQTFTGNVPNTPTTETAGEVVARRGQRGETGEQGFQGVGITDIVVSQSGTQSDVTTGIDYDIGFDLVDPSGEPVVDPVQSFRAPRGEQGAQGVNVGTLSIGEASDQSSTNGGIRYDFTLSRIDPLGVVTTPTVGQFIAPEGPEGPPGTARATLFDSGVTYDLGDFVFDTNDNLYMSLIASNTAALNNATAWLHITAIDDTTYTFASGTDGSFMVTPSDTGIAQTVTVGTLGVSAQDEGTAVTGNFTTLNFIGSGVTASDAGSGILNINITGGGGGTTFSPSVAVGSGWPGADNPIGSLTDPVVAFTVSNFDGFTLTGLTVSGDVVNSNVDANFEGGSFTFDYDASVPGTYTVHFDVAATDNTHGDTFTHRVTHSSRVYAPVYAQTLAAQPTAVSDFTGQGTEFGSEFSFEYAGTGMAYMLVPMEVSNPVFHSGFLFLNNTNLGVIDTNWTLFRIDDYVAPGTLTVTLTDGG